MPVKLKPFDLTEIEEVVAVAEIPANLLNEHDAGECTCDLTGCGYGLCLARQYEDGVITAQQLIAELA